MTHTMTSIRMAKVEDIQGMLDCMSRVWESLRDVLPTDWVEDEIENTRQPDAEDRLQKVITDPNRITLVAEGDGEIAGFALGRTDKSGLSWLSFMGVSLTCRRRGIGRGLVQRYIEESRMRDANKVSLNTAPELKPAVKLYADMGFLPEGLMRRHRYGVDLIVYSRFLD
jgi:ribosomal protein S18 acetylase RimI-like enzyme